MTELECRVERLETAMRFFEFELRNVSDAVFTINEATLALTKLMQEVLQNLGKPEGE